MTGTMQYILWIDDEISREGTSKTLEEALNIKVEFYNVHGAKIMDILNEVNRKSEPNLILIDHWLNNIEGPSERGSSIAEILREKWTDCPIVAITGVADEIDEHQKNLYEDVIPIEDLSNSHSLIKSIVTDFQALRTDRPDSIDNLIKKLNPPLADVEMLRSIIPKHLRNFKDKSLLINIYKWIRSELYARPGFLYDAIWTATFIGIKVESLNKVKNIISPAQYNGLFSDIDNPRWWKTKLRDIIYKSLPDEETALPWLLGMKLPGLSDEDKSKCYRDDCTETDPPEIVAYTDETLSNRKPMHRKCTVKHPLFENSLYFEEIRMMGSN